MAQTAKGAVQKQVRFPVPVGGLNSVDNVMDVGPEYAYMCNNMITRPFGLEIRKGYREWLPTGTALSHAVVTMMGYTSTDGAIRKIFASTGDPDSTVYDISAPNAAPVVSFTPGAGAVVPGEWSYTGFQTPAGQYLCAVLFGKGYYTYNSVAGWVKVADGNGAGKIEFIYGSTTYTSDQMIFTFSWKNRLWFLQADTGLVWYLPVNQITGKATAIDLGQFLRRGGGFAFAVNWTYDSGEGLDDRLVFVGNEGDMVIYAGTDPSSAATFKLEGVWFIGRVPAGRRCFNQYGGDIVVLTEYGIISVSDFVSGRIVNPQGQSQVAEKFNPTLARDISRTSSQKYWQVITYPGEELIFVISPFTNDAGVKVDYLMSHFNRSWSTATNIPAYCGLLYLGRVLIGSEDGKVYEAFSGFRDGDSYDSAVEGQEITGQFLASFQDFGTPTANKRAQRVRMVGRCDGNPGYVAAIRSVFEDSFYLDTPSPAVAAGALWDVALWDDAQWQSRSNPFKKWFGVAGFGKKLAVQVAIRGLGYTLLTDYEVTFEEGAGL